MPGPESIHDKLLRAALEFDLHGIQSNPGLWAFHMTTTTSTPGYQWHTTLSHDSTIALSLDHTTVQGRTEEVWGHVRASEPTCTNNWIITINILRYLRRVHRYHSSCLHDTLPHRHSCTDSQFSSSGMGVFSSHFWIMDQQDDSSFDPEYKCMNGILFRFLFLLS